MKEVKKMAKATHPEAALGNPGKYTGNDLKNHENNEAGDAPITAESNVESLRFGKKPKKSSTAAHAPENKAHLAKARKFACRSEHGGADPMAVAGQ
jgi:hypothetical protein